MPPSDQEPRYQLVDSNDNVVGSFFGDGSGNVVIADETDTQTTFGPDGITTPALKAKKSDVKNVAGKLVWETSNNQTVQNQTGTEVEFDTAEINDSIVDADPSNNNITINDAGKYRITAAITWNRSTDWSPPEVTQMRILSDGELVVKERHTRANTKRETFTTSITINATSGTSISTAVYHASGSGRELANSIDSGTGLGRLEVERV